MNKRIAVLMHKHGLSDYAGIREMVDAFAYDMYREGLTRSVEICDKTTVVPGVSPVITIRAALAKEVASLDETTKYIRKCREERDARSAPKCRDPEKVFERTGNGWNITVYRNADGSAMIDRVSGGGCKPLCWNSPDKTPEEWVSIQEDADEYRCCPTGNESTDMAAAADHKM